MRSWRRASKGLDCGGPEPHCRIEAGAPYQRVELAMGTIKDRCVEHASEPVNQAQLDVFDAQQAADPSAPTAEVQRRPGRSPSGRAPTEAREEGRQEAGG